MSVIEFFILYWDWWLLIGFLFSAAALVDSNVNLDFISHVLVITAPPIYVLIIMNWAIKQSKN